MAKLFRTVGLITRHRKTTNNDVSDILMMLMQFLIDRQLAVIVEADTANYIPGNIGQLKVYPCEKLGQHCDLIIVVGGDGSLLTAAHCAVDHDTPVLGVNRGRLGFLTDIHPRELTAKLGKILDGKFIQEQRFLLHASIHKDQTQIGQDIALNDVVLTSGDVPRMIEFATHIDEQFVSSQYADGIIIATPTGSTAYALSGGGPILHPSLDALVLVPMFPHTLSARPIVLKGNSRIRITVASSTETAAQVSCDGRARIPVPPSTTIEIAKKREPLQLIHPEDYNYFETLRSKLRWG